MFIPFQGLEKGTVLQEVRVFNEVPLVPRHCIHVLSKILYVLAQSEKLTTTEATDTFFAVTKLFQSKDVPLRRMVYLTLKELLPLAEDTIMVIASLTKDMNSQIELYRSNALRVFSRIADVQILTQSERYLKQAIVDKDASVASAALVSSLHICRAPGGPELVRRWIHEIQTAIKSRDSMVQYHALGLMHQLRRADRLALSKLVFEVSRASVRSPFTYCLLIRYTSELLELEHDPAERARMFQFLDSCLYNKSEVVAFEAARAVCNLDKISAQELAHTISVLQLFLGSAKPTLRYAAMRTLHRVAAKCPVAVVPCNSDMEVLVQDPNRNIATLAIGTLLKTGDESSVDRLLKSISGFISEINDEFKIVIVDAIKLLCLKYPSKFHTMLVFLTNMLRDDGGFDYKAAVVASVLEIMQAIVDSRELALNRLGEYIEDCEFPVLSTRVLHVLGIEGPKLSNPSRFILYVYNRVNLESSMVRAAAVGALARFGAIPDLRGSVLVLLRRCLADSDDEVRERALFHLRVLERDVMDQFAVADVDLAAVEESLRAYVVAGDFSVPYTLEMAADLERTKRAGIAVAALAAAPAAGVLTAARSGARASKDAALADLRAVPGVGADWELFKSTAPVALTELETEYVVHCTKHVFADGHIVLEFSCRNTLEEMQLTNVSVHVAAAAAARFARVGVVECPLLRPGETGRMYCVLGYDRAVLPRGSLACTLRYNAAEVSPDTGHPVEEPSPDEYPLRAVDVGASDYVRAVVRAQFPEAWVEFEQAPDFQESKVNVALGARSLAAVVAQLIALFGLAPCADSDIVPDDAGKHILYLSGVGPAGEPALVRVRMRLDGSGAPRTLLELCVRSTNPALAQLLLGVFE